VPTTMHSKRFLRLVLGLTLAVVSAGVLVSARGQAAATADTPVLKYEVYALSNGLRVILSPDHRLPLTAVNLWYHVGPANEDPGRTGFAHLFEHMMFQGSKHVPGDQHFKLLEGAGASDINGTTDFDRTNYFETVPSNQLELALWLESDRLGYLLEQVTPEALANQQDVVRNERRQSVENQPYGIVEEALFHTIFPKEHPYYADVIGSHEDIQAAKLEDVRNFFKQYYTPNNASLAIVGDFEPEAVKKLVEKYFGTFKRGPEVKKPSVATPPIDSERRMTVTDTVELPKVYVAWLSPAIYSEGDADAEVAASILGGGKSSRLYKALVYEQQIAQSVTAQQHALILGSVFTIEAIARPGKTAEQIETAINAEIDKFRASGPDASEIERAQNGIETEIVNGLQRLGGFGGVADRLNTYEHYLGDPGYLAKDLQRYRGTTTGSVKAFAAKYLQPNARVVVFGVPGEKKLAPEVPKPSGPPTATADVSGVNPDESWRTERPAAGPEPILKLPTPTRFTLPNGLTVLYTRRAGVPVVSASVVVRTGSDANPTDAPGLANFTAAMLDEGTETRSALQIADEVARLGATLATGSTMDSSTVSATSLRKTFPETLQLVADVILHPNFPQAEVDRQRASRLATLVQQRENPQQVAQRALVAALFGSRHPYGFTEIGTEASNKAITRDAMVAFWKQNFVANNAALIIVGDIEDAQVKGYAEKYFGGWPKGTPAQPALGAPDTTPAKLIVVDKPGAPQTQLWVGTIGAPRRTPEYATIQVLNNGLGGQFSARLNMNLREDKGYTYGAFSTFVMRKAAGPFFALAGVRTDVTGPALSEMLKEVTGVATKPLTEEELKLAKDALVRSLPGDFETNQSTAASFAGIYVYDLGLDYWTKYPSMISGVDSAAVTTGAKKYLTTDRLHVVAVGDKAKILQQIEQLNLNLGAPELRDANGAKLQ
jgi:zinc protease